MVAYETQEQTETQDLSPPFPLGLWTPPPTDLFFLPVLKDPSFLRPPSTLSLRGRVQ